MSFPSDVQLVTVTCGTGYDFSGEPVSIAVTVTPTLGWTLKRLIHATTGTFLTRDELTFKSDPGIPLTFKVPNPAQTETWKDGSGTFFSGSYSVTVQTRSASGKVQTWMQPFQPVAGQVEVDLDLVPDGQIGAPSSAPVPAVTDVNEKAGSVTIAEPTDRRRHGRFRGYRPGDSRRPGCGQRRGNGHPGHRYEHPTYRHDC